MSFSKAKIHRFNDEIPCAPPPGTYNPEMPSKTVGPIIHKTERFSFNKYDNLFSSTESLNSVQYQSDSCRNSFVFKTPKQPASSFKIPYTDVRRKVDFIRQKAASTEFINKENSHEISSLRCSLNMIQEELNFEQARTEKLLREVTRLKKDNEQSEMFTNSMVEVIFEKNNIIASLQEKCRILQMISSENMESYHEHIRNIYSIFENHFKVSLESDTEFYNIVERYQEIISQYENDFEHIYSFLTDVSHKNNCLKYEQYRSEDSDDERICQLIEALRGAENELKKYEITIREMQKVVAVLTDRVHESDLEVEKVTQEMQSVNKEKEKLCEKIRLKDDEMSEMRNMINSAAENFVDEIQIKEKNLISLVDEFKEKALAKKVQYEETLAQKTETIFELLAEKNQKELELQEALDQIETLKCKEETLSKILDQIRCDSMERNSEINNPLGNGSRRLSEWRNFHEECYSNSIDNGYTNGANNGLSNGYCIDNFDVNEEFQSYVRQNKMEGGLFADFERRLSDFFDEKLSDSEWENSAQVVSFDSSVQETNFSIIENIFIENLCKMKTGNEFGWIRKFLLFIYNTFYKFAGENKRLKNDLTRLHKDFVGKCEECAELTHLIQVSEKQVEYTEKKTEELRSSQNDWEAKCSDQQQEIEGLKCELLALQLKLAEEQSRTAENDTVINSLTTKLNDLHQTVAKVSEENMEERLSQFENSLKEEQLKTESLQKQNTKLQTLIGPYRQILESFEAESKCLNSKSEVDLIQKFSTILELENRKQKIKQVIKLRNDVNQLKRKNDELVIELGKYRKTAQKPGKENKIFNKSKKPLEKKSSVPEIPINSTYVVTSPKVNRI